MEKKVLQPQPGMQTEYLSRGETEVFFGGEAGGGKSEALLIGATRYVNKKTYKAVIFRRTYPDLEDLIHRAQQIYCAPGMGARFNAAKHIFRFPAGARIKFSHMQHVKHMYSHQGQEYDFIGWDELPQFPRIVYTYLFSRLRGKDPEIRRFVRSTGNPDGEGLLWVKARFIDPAPPLETRYFLSRGDVDLEVSRGTPESVSRAFVPSIRKENIALMGVDPEYESRLNLLPEAQKNALKFGLWNILDRSNQVIKTEWWQKALDGKNARVGGPWALGGDYAHEGADTSVLLTGRGNAPFKIETWPQTRTDTFADLIAERIHEKGYQIVAGYDALGPGVGVHDSMRRLHEDVLDRCEPCHKKDEEFDKKWAVHYHFDSLRSQMWWKFRDDMEHGRIDLSDLQGKVLPDPDRPGEVITLGYVELLHKLQEEVLAHTYEVRNGKIFIKSKNVLRTVDKGIGRSPDLADALVIWNWVRDHHGFGFVPPPPPPGVDYGLDELDAEEEVVSGSAFT